MNKAYTLFLFTFVISQGLGTAINQLPTQPLEEANHQLESLQTDITVAINGALRTIDGYEHNVVYKRNTAFDEAKQATSEGFSTFKEVLANIIQLAQVGNHDIAPCLIGREDAFGALSNSSAESLKHCLVASNVDITEVINDSRYRIDNVINTVHQLGYHLDLCTDNLSCIRSVVTKVGEEKANLLAIISLEVTRTKNLLEILSSSNIECASTVVNIFKADGNRLLAQTAECFNIILSS